VVEIVATAKIGIPAEIVKEELGKRDRAWRVLR
jgi:hypothetical protein